MDQSQEKMAVIFIGVPPSLDKAAEAAECICQCSVYQHPTDVFVSIEGRPGDLSSAFIASLFERIDAASTGSQLACTMFSRFMTGDSEGKHSEGKHALRCIELLEREYRGSNYVSVVLFTANGACTLVGGRFLLPADGIADDQVYVARECAAGVVIGSICGLKRYVSPETDDRGKPALVEFECATKVSSGDNDGKGVGVVLDVTSVAYRTRVFQCITPSFTMMRVHGWVNAGFADAFSAALDNMPEGQLTIIELGTWMGLSANMMAKAVKARTNRHDNSVIITVDTWLGSAEHFTTIPQEANILGRDNGYPRLYRSFLQYTKNMSNHDIISPLPLPTQQAIFVLEHQGVVADVVYVDAAHDEEAAYADIRAYWRILRPGTGWMIGDDWAWDGVRRAVERFAAEHELTIHSDRGVWWLLANGL